MHSNLQIFSLSLLVPMSGHSKGNGKRNMWNREGPITLSKSSLIHQASAKYYESYYPWNNSGLNRSRATPCICRGGDGGGGSSVRFCKLGEDLTEHAEKAKLALEESGVIAESQALSFKTTSVAFETMCLASCGRTHRKSSSERRHW